MSLGQILCTSVLSIKHQPTGPSTEDKLNAILAEYESLRLEVLNRISSQNLFVQIHVLALTSIIGATIFRIFGVWVAFLIPIESSIIGLWHIDNSIRIIKIGEYIQFRIEPRVSRLLKEDSIMNWESYVANERIYRHKRATIFNARLISLLTFGAPSLTCLLIIFIILIVERFQYILQMDPRVAYLIWTIGLILTLSYLYYERQRTILFDNRSLQEVGGDYSGGK